MTSTTKDYYSLKEICEFGFLKRRALMYRMIELKEKYAQTNYLKKINRKWIIHKSILQEFERKRKNKIDKIYEYKSFVTLNFDSSYNKEYLLELMKMAFNILSKDHKHLKIFYVIEKTKKNSKKLHLHFLINLSKASEKNIYNACKYYTDINFHIENLSFIPGVFYYLNKEVIKKGVLIK